MLSGYRLVTVSLKIRAWKHENVVSVSAKICEWLCARACVCVCVCLCVCAGCDAGMHSCVVCAKNCVLSCEVTEIDLR